VTSRCTIRTEADPTPFVAAFLTCDVVATLVFKGRDFALRARFEIIISREVVEFPITDVCATDSSMSSRSASHAYILPADASCRSVKPTTPSNEVQAPVFRAPTQVRVHVDVYIHFESDVLFENIFWTVRFDVLLGELSITAVLHARDLYDLSVLDISFQMLW
jgi:hypothetical protein